MKQYNEQELQIFRKCGKILAMALALVETKLAPGVSTLELDAAVEEFIRGMGAEPCFKGYNGYGFATCISVNNEIIHTFPRANSVLREGDIVSVDAGVRLDGFCTDAARTFEVGKVSPHASRLIEATRNSFFAGIHGLKAGVKVGEIGARVEKFITKTTPFSVLRNYFGHGIGHTIHETPLIPNFVPSDPRLIAECDKILPENSVICIEPMVNEGSAGTRTLEDGWTVVTADNKLSAHYENTVIVKKDGVEIITLL